MVCPIFAVLLPYQTIFSIAKKNPKTTAHLLCPYSGSFMGSNKSLELLEPAKDPGQVLRKDPERVPG